MAFVSMGYGQPIEPPGIELKLEAPRILISIYSETELWGFGNDSENQALGRE